MTETGTTKTKKDTIDLEINGRPVQAPAGVTVLRAAELNGIYIPTLCSHKDLSPYGGCRLCLVEIEGMRGYPLSCYVKAEAGMKVRTETVALREIRREVLQLILSEHPSSCLICDEAEECAEFSTTVRKTGVATGCRYCPNDRQCELQAVVEHLEVKEVGYPIRYRGFEPERQDPFYDRDYNLCILCGRCVRMCQEMRGTAVLAFNWRGSKATIGPAFGRNHIEAGCEFCGACVSVCPTGALVEKASKWEGKPGAMVESTCPFCPVGCRLELWHKEGRFVKALPCHEPAVNDGQACLKGRFCQGEISHHFERARKPLALDESGRTKEVTWEQACDRAARVLRDLDPADYAMVLSPDLDCEGLYAAQKFARLALGTNNLDCTARRAFAGGPAFWVSLFGNPTSLDRIKGAKRILAVGLDTRFNFSIAGVEVRKALRDGARLVTIDARESNLARYAHHWLQPPPGREGAVLAALLDGAKGKGDHRVPAARLREAAAALAGGPEVVLLGPEALACGLTSEMAEILQKLARRKGTTLIPLYNGTNARGALEMGAFPELFPGGVAPGSKGARTIKEHWGAAPPRDPGLTLDELMAQKRKPRVIHLVGAMPWRERPPCDFLIVQDIFAPPFPADLFLPAASFLEAEGTLINLEGRVQESPRLEELPDSVQYGRARPDWWILSRLAGKLGAKGFAWRSPAALRREIAGLVPGFPARVAGAGEPRTMAAGGRAAPETGAVRLSRRELMLFQAPTGYTHRGVNMIPKVEGLQLLDPDRGLFLNPEDAARLGIEEGMWIRVTAGERSGTGRARLRPEVPAGFVRLVRPDTPTGPHAEEGEGDLSPLYTLKRNPCPVEVSKNGI